MAGIVGLWEESRARLTSEPQLHTQDDDGAGEEPCADDNLLGAVLGPGRAAHHLLRGR